MSAYYNENDPKAAAWLRELIKQKLIAPGVVDDRSILEVQPNDLKEFTQCHFFAGIGVWSYALRCAGWSDDRPVWTGSCPCQPFSAAGKGEGTDDERHLWPDWYRLIRECRPAVVFGEQVASKAGLGWLDLVQANLEESGYASGANDICAAGVGAPHIRQRLWFVAERLGDTLDARLEGHPGNGDDSDQPGRIDAESDRPAPAGSGSSGMADSEHDQQRHRRGSGSEGAQSDESRAEPGGRGEVGRMANTSRDRDREHAGELCGDEGQHEDRASIGDHSPVTGRSISGMVDAPGDRRRQSQAGQTETRPSTGRVVEGSRADQPRELQTGFEGSNAEFVSGMAEGGRDEPAVPGPTNGLWRDSDWLFCRDGKWRPVEPGTFPLVNGAPARVGRLRGYGNAINAEVAKVYIETFMEYRP